MAIQVGVDAKVQTWSGIREAISVGVHAIGWWIREKSWVDRRCYGSGVCLAIQVGVDAKVQTWSGIREAISVGVHAIGWWIRKKSIFNYYPDYAFFSP
ncbi:MAG: hypothetical protein KMY53_14335 [Desulfarculus sp.]|nr:hypothetical protein [Pseudomonadota bacterium]MBV1739342.1 hypothetical protein [Desulfarculus sp.]